MRAAPGRRRVDDELAVIQKITDVAWVVVGTLGSFDCTSLTY
jgi:hypothetical protein